MDYFVHDLHLAVSGNKALRLDWSHQWYLVLKTTQSPLHRTLGKEGIGAHGSRAMWSYSKIQHSMFIKYSSKVDKLDKEYWYTNNTKCKICKLPGLTIQ